MRAIVHIGMHKTGTTSVKKYCADHRDSLLNLGILYPQSIGDLAKNCECKTEDSESLKRVFSGELEQIPTNGTVYICSETYFNMGDPEKERLIEFLHSFDLQISVLCYLRPQVSHVVSYYQQRVQDAFRRNRPLRHKNALEHFDDLMKDGYYRYAQVLDRWRKLISKKAMRVRVYDRNHLHGGCTLRDSASVVGFRVDDMYGVKKGIGLSAERLYCLKTMINCMDHSNFSREHRKMVIRKLLEENQRNPDLPLDISTQEKIHISNACLEDNTRLAETYLEPDHSYLFMEQDVDSLNGKAPEQVAMSDVSAIFLNMCEEIPGLRNLKPLFLDCLKSSSVV